MTEPTIGERFGDLTVIGSLRSGGAGIGRVLSVKCSCGTIKTVRWSNLKIGHTTSCGDQDRHPRSGRHFMHGTPEYRAWQAVIQRCTNPHSKSWVDYGGRGITVCDAWRDFSSFIEDMGSRPEGRVLDRIDNDGNYEPSNCRWATVSESQKNRRRSRPPIGQGYGPHARRVPIP